MKDMLYILKLNRIMKKVCSLCQKKFKLRTGFINLLGLIILKIEKKLESVMIYI